MPKQNQQSEPEPTASPPPQPRKPLSMAVTLTICVSGWLLPGVSHLALGKWGRAIVLTLSVLTMFGLGIAMNGRLYDITPEQPLHIFAFVANVGIGLPYILVQRLGLGGGVLSSPTYDYGTTFLWVSGLLNYLIILDAFDIAQGRKP